MKYPPMNFRSRIALHLSTTRLCIALLCAGLPVAYTNGYAAAQDQSEERKPASIDFKLTNAWYRSSDGNHANDINLRANYGDYAAWIGQYRDHQNYQQTRTGYEFTEHLGSAQIVWSAQAASNGFLGGSINAQVGDTTYAQLGFGRTNLKNYYNLNFDPNDAITVGVGHHLNSETDLSLYQVRDDRLHTRQRITHLYLHHGRSEPLRYSIDVTYKSGLNSDGNFITGYGLTATVALREYFVRIAHDQNANFSTATQTRVAFGLSF